jgi:N-acyl homoserine lactone hydrolase
MRLITLAAAVSALVLASACGSETPVADDPGAEPTPETQEKAALEVDVLDCGALDISDLDGFSTAGDYAGIEDSFVDPCFLVRHPDGMLLWDLGLPGILTIAGPQTQDVFTVSLEKTLTQQLEERGVVPSEIDFVSISHSHFDHIGQADQVQGATWLVSEAELSAMFPAEGDTDIDPEQQAMFTLFEPMEKQVFSGELDVFGDGSVVIFETPGHTPGHTSLQLMMPESGPVLLTGDLYHRAESRDLKRVPRFNADEPTTLSSMDSFEARAEAIGATVIIQHEPADIEPLEGKIR